METTIVYVTDNVLPLKFAQLVRDKLVEAVRGKPIISVSQKPIELGLNICLGDIGRSWLSIYKQLNAGLEAVKTPYVAVVEHDCLYTPEHFDFIPPRKDLFYYNANHWLAQHTDKLRGMYSYYPRRLAMSQMICHIDAFSKHVKETLGVLEEAYKETSTSARRRKQAELGKDLKADYKYFRTKLPNLDIRHDCNFTGARRGKKRCYELPYWGKLEEVLKC